MFYTYTIISESNPQKRYIGFTSDINKRLKAHNDGKCNHTSKFSPWKLKVYIAFPDKIKALNFEKYLKSGSGHAFANRHF